MTAKWFIHLGACYRKGYEAFSSGTTRDQCPYLSGEDGNGSSRGGNVQRQRQFYWQRGWDRASQGKPFDDTNG